MHVVQENVPAGTSPGRTRRPVASPQPPPPPVRAVDRDPRLRRRLLRQFDRAVSRHRDLFVARFGETDLDALIAECRAEYARVIERLPWIGGRANPRTFNLDGSAIWLALWRTLEPRGFTLDDARSFFPALFRAWWSRYPRVLRHLFGRYRLGPWYQRRLRRLALRSQARENPADYVYLFVPGEPGRFDYGLDFTECAILKFFRAEGAEALVPILCDLDWPHTELMDVALHRTTTLAKGGDRCDFRVARAGARDVGRKRATLPSVLLHGLVGWAACGAVMGVLLATATEPVALAVHAAAAPVVFAALTAHLYRRQGRRSPLALAAGFTGLVMALDLVVVAGLIQRSLAMFASPLGTWIPFALIFAATWVTGVLVDRDRPGRQAVTPWRTNP